MGEIKISLLMQKLVTVTCSLLDQKEIIRTEDKTCMTKKTPENYAFFSV